MTRAVALVGTVVAATGFAMAGVSSAAITVPGQVNATFAATLAAGSNNLTFSGSGTGTIDASGNITFPAAAVTWSATQITASGVTIDVQPVANSAFTGTIDVASGLFTLSGQLSTNLTNAALGLASCPVGPFALELSTANAGGAAYSDAAGTATLTDPAFRVEAIPVPTAGCPDAIIAVLNGPPPGLGPLPRDDGGPITLAVTLVGVAPGTPTATDDRAETKPGEAVTIDVRANDAASATLAIDETKFAITTAPTKGTAAIVDGKIVYTPNAGVAGTTDTFVYTLCSVPNTDGTVPCDTATVTITIAAVQATATTTAPTAAAALPRTGGSSLPLAIGAFALIVAGLAFALQSKTAVRRP